MMNKKNKNKILKISNSTIIKNTMFYEEENDDAYDEEYYDEMSFEHKKTYTCKNQKFLYTETFDTPRYKFLHKKYLHIKIF